MNSYTPTAQSPVTGSARHTTKDRFLSALQVIFFGQENEDSTKKCQRIETVFIFTKNSQLCACNPESQTDKPDKSLLSDFTTNSSAPVITTRGQQHSENLQFTPQSPTQDQTTEFQSKQDAREDVVMTEAISTFPYVSADTQKPGSLSVTHEESFIPTMVTKAPKSDIHQTKPTGRPSHHNKVSSSSASRSSHVKVSRMKDDVSKPVHVQVGKKRRVRQRNFRCNLCSVTCSNRGQLRGHLRTHTGERPFQCQEPDCRKTFVRNEELTRHRRIHSGERPYPCGSCGKAFMRKDHLNKHIRMHDDSKLAVVDALGGC
ncbi:uncharacterized protein LOC143279332 [Babylonia areolata]|uniref:uncharacterized protein LOC143279332 n=1 Tax=Babylonia areolata TaxID=304850 RepID=UPI003FD17ED5